MYRNDKHTQSWACFARAEQGKEDQVVDSPNGLIGISRKACSTTSAQVTDVVHSCDDEDDVVIKRYDHSDEDTSLQNATIGSKEGISATTARGSATGTMGTSLTDRKRMVLRNCHCACVIVPLFTITTAMFCIYIYIYIYICRYINRYSIW
jgi:hypothetical protein